jgi:hypothetical protein
MPENREVGTPFQMILQAAPLKLWGNTRDGDRAAIHFVARQELEPYYDDKLREFRCLTKGYWYTVSDSELEEIISWHWHPSSHPSPHVHVKGGFDGHIPSGRVTFESVVRFTIDEIGVTPAHQRWEQVLTEQEDRHRDHRTWH